MFVIFVQLYTYSYDERWKNGDALICSDTYCMYVCNVYGYDTKVIILKFVQRGFNSKNLLAHRTLFLKIILFFPEKM